MHDQVLRRTRILGLGGHTTPDPLDSLLLARVIIADGTRGVVFGRNAIQRPEPMASQRALRAVVKHGLDPREACRDINL